MADLATCVHCTQVFKKRKKYRGLDKRPLSLKLRKANTDTTVLDALRTIYLYEGPAHGHVCGNCFLLMEQAYSQINGGKRKERTPGSTPQKKKLCSKSADLTFEPLVTSTPKKSRRSLFSRQSEVSTSKKKMTGTIKDIKEAVSRGRYQTAFNQILARSPKSQIAFRELIRKTVRTEMKDFLKKDHKYKGAVETVATIENFSWEEMMGDVKYGMPTLLAAIEGSMGMKDRAVINTRKSKLAPPRMGMMISIPLYTHQPTQYKVPQAVCSAQMWRSGCSEKLFKSLNHLGICQSLSTTRDVVDRLCAEPDRELTELKDNLEKEIIGDQDTNNLAILMELADEDDSDLDVDYTPSESEDEAVDLSHESLCPDECEPVPEAPSREEVAPHPGYAFVWDNIQKLSQCRDSSTDNRNEMHLWANAFVAVNRVEPSRDLSQNCLKAKDIPTLAFLHTIDDAALLHERCRVIVSRVIVTHLDHFREYYSDVVTWHVPHRYSEEMAKKSKTINIGIIDENPSSRAGTIRIMQKLQDGVPRQRDGTYRVCPCHGDGGSVERMNDGKKARSADPTDTDRLEGLEQTPQEFHHRGLMLQDNLDLLFNTNSIGERGTLAQLKNDFNHRNVTSTAMHSFNDVENLLRFSTEAHIIYLAMKQLQINKLDGVPSKSNPRASAKERLMYLNAISTDIVDTVWLLPDCSEVANVVEAEVKGSDTDWCFCNAEEEIDGLMVRCSNQECHLGSWFHVSCMNMEPDQVPGMFTDWWCSTECQATGRSILCNCKRTQAGPVVHCASKDCKRGGIFHLVCINLKEEPVSPWYCSTACQETGGAEPDYQRNYSIALTWYGLMDRVHRDMIREGDGLAMMAMWRINMTRFWSKNHYKYLIIGHRLLASVNGWLPPRLIEEILHNRTCNLRGGPGHNIPMDRVNEFLNNEFKETLRHTHGQYTKETVHRAGRMVGTLAKGIDNVFSLQVAGIDMEDTYRKHFDYKKDITIFVDEYWDDDFFSVVPGRRHATFPLFNNDSQILHPEKLKERLHRYSKKLDNSREVLD